MRGLIFIVLWGSLFVAGCASTTVDTHYYLLYASAGSQTDAAVFHEQDNTRPLVSLETVELAEFLRQSGLVIQLGEHQLYSSRYHIWAESLVDAIPKALLRDLRTLSQQYRFERKTRNRLGVADYRLHLQIDQFQPNNHSKVTVAGRYWLHSANCDKQSIIRDFIVQKNLSEDGYAHSVGQLRSLLYRLATDILNALNVSSELLVSRNLCSRQP